MSSSPDEPLDELDAAILAGVKDFWTVADPMPIGLADRVKFVIELDNVELEVMRMSELVEPAAARGDERSRLITFDSDTLTIMVSIRPNPDGTIRVDGWLTPAGRHPIELRVSGGTAAGSTGGTATGSSGGAATGLTGGAATVSDEDGRFVLDTIQPGLAQLVVRPDGSTRTVTTPSISL